MENGLAYAENDRAFVAGAVFEASFISSFIVFHSPQDGHFPYHLGDSYPHSEQMNTLFIFALLCHFRTR